MDFLQILILSLVQGITEFLPISSSAHLILTPYILGYEDQGLAFDVAVHVGTLIAVVTYFRVQIRSILKDWFLSLAKKEHAYDKDNANLGWYILAATIPVMLSGLVLSELVATELRSPLVIAITTIGFGVLLWWSDRSASEGRKLSQMTWKDVLIIGCMQAIAIIPGTSRSGITITAGLLLGLSRESAARFSFLLAVPTIVMSSAYVTKQLLSTDINVDWFALGLGVVLSAIAAFITITYFMKFIEKIGMLPFVIYRFILGAGILYFIL